MVLHQNQHDIDQWASIANARVMRLRLVQTLSRKNYYIETVKYGNSTHPRLIESVSDKTFCLTVSAKASMSSQSSEGLGLTGDVNVDADNNSSELPIKGSPSPGQNPVRR